jgi:hypothetical protein
MENAKQNMEAMGSIEKKEQALTKSGDKYWKFTIDGRNFTLFDADDRGLEVGDEVKISFHETQKGKFIYRNINGIVKSDNVTEEKVVSNAPPLKSVAQVTAKGEANLTEYKEKEADVYEIGMAKNNAALLMSKIIEKLETADQIREFLKGAGPEYKALVKDMFLFGKSIRKEMIGY